MVNLIKILIMTSIHSGRRIHNLQDQGVTKIGKGEGGRKEEGYI